MCTLIAAQDSEEQNHIKKIVNLVLSIFKKRSNEGIVIFLFCFLIWLLYNIDATKFAYFLKYLVEEIGAFQMIISTGIIKGFFVFFIPYLFNNQKETILQCIYFIIYYCTFYGITSIITNYFYLSLEIFLGNDTNFLTISKKVLVELLTACPIFYIPWYVFGTLLGVHYCNIFKWYDAIIEKKMFSWNGIIFDWWFPGWICTICVSLPSLVVIYGLPLALQSVMGNLIGTFKAIIIVDVAMNERIGEEDCSTEKTNEHQHEEILLPQRSTP